MFAIEGSTGINTPVGEGDGLSARWAESGRAESGSEMGGTGDGLIGGDSSRGVGESEREEMDMDGGLSSFRGTD